MKYKIFIICILLAAVIYTNLVNIHKNINKVKINEVFPYNVLGWHGKDDKVDALVYKMLDKDEILLRTYSNPKKNNMSLAIVFTTKRDHVHDPEICYRGQGISMSNEKNIQLNKDLNVKLVDGKKNNVPYQMVYWFTDLDKSYSDRAKYMKDITIDRFFSLKDKDQALIVIICPKAKDNTDIENFAISLNNILKNIKAKNIKN